MTEESFWESMQKSAEPARSMPSWMKGGINLSERNFVTFRPNTQEVALPSKDARLRGILLHLEAAADLLEALAEMMEAK